MESPLIDSKRTQDTIKKIIATVKEVIIIIKKSFVILPSNGKHFSPMKNLVISLLFNRHIVMPKLSYLIVALQM